MDAPPHATETPDSFVWLDDGIVHLQSKSASITDDLTDSQTDLVAATLKVALDLSGGLPLPVLIDTRQWSRTVPEAWTAFISRAASVFSSAAFLVDPQSSPALGAFPEAISRLLIPCRAFTDEAEALAFLQGFLPDQPSVMDPPDDAVETTGTFVWRSDGVIFFKSRGKRGTLETATTAFDAFRDLADGVPTPLLFDAREWPGGDAEAWAVFRSVGTLRTAYAMLVKPDSKVEMGPFMLDRLGIPAQVFTDEAEALAFLQPYKA